MAATTILLMPLANKTYITTSGATYSSDKNSIVASASLSTQDVIDLKAAGGAVLNPPPTDLLGSLIDADFNSTSDQEFNLGINIKYRVKRIVALNTTVNGMSTAVGGVYTAASKGGSALVANTQVYTGLTNPLTALELTLALPNLVLAAGTPLFLSLTTGHGAAAHADLYIFGETYPSS